jgi:hypothetical protein
MRERRISGLAGQTQSFSQGKRTSVLSVASVLSAIVYALIGLTLALRPGDAACSGGRICAPVPSTPSLRSLERS